MRRPNWPLQGFLAEKIFLKYSTISLKFLVPHNKIYYVLRQISDIFVMKNLTFYLVWPTIPLGAIRATLVLLITLDRVVASFFPIFYHNHRRRIPILAVISCVITFGLSDHIVLFEYCKYTVDVPLACDNFNCVINQCFFNYWSLRDQVQYFIIGVLSVLLCFRLFIWNNYVAIHANQVLSRVSFFLFFCWKIFSLNFLFLVWCFSKQKWGCKWT